RPRPAGARPACPRRPLACTRYPRAGPARQGSVTRGAAPPALLLGGLGRAAAGARYAAGRTRRAALFRSHGAARGVDADRRAPAGAEPALECPAARRAALAGTAPRCHDAERRGVLARADHALRGLDRAPGGAVGLAPAGAVLRRPGPRRRACPAARELP